MGKVYIQDTTPVLNFDVSSDVLEFQDTIQTLNFDVSSTVLEFQDVTSILNFDLLEYDGTHPVYKILLDFLESFTVGDIF